MLRSLCLTFAGLVLGGLAVASGLVVDYEPLAGHVAHEDALLFYTNHERARSGLAELRRDEALTLAARHHAAEMARLAYMSHESPVPENATVAHRVARAGSAAVRVGENLARVRHDASSAHTAVQGWMDSPGHRANLLNADFTHVGFGTAPNGSGGLYVVQVLAGQPLRIVNATVTGHLVETPQVEVAFELRVPSDVLIGYGEHVLPPRSLQAGRHTSSFPFTSGSPVHVRAGVRPFSGDGGFIGQDGGWFDPVASRWGASDSFPREDLRILDVAARPLREEMNRIVLRLEGGAPPDVGVWVNETWHDEFEIVPDGLRIDVPSHLEDSEIGVGLPVPGGDGRYRIVLALGLRSEGGVPRLHPPRR